MSQENFFANWKERSLFVEPGAKPISQRQLNLYYYFLFIKNALTKCEVKKVLEVGAGRGTISFYLVKYLGLKLTVLDNEPAAVALARENFAQLDLTAEFVVSDALVTGLPANSFDAVVSIGLAEHFPATEVEKLFAEEYRLLRPGGMMISLNIPKKFSIQSLNTIMRFFKKIFGHYQDNIRRDYYRNNLRAKDFAQLARKVGFNQVQITYVCPFPIWVPITPRTDRLITWLRKIHLWLRQQFMSYPYKTNSLIAQAHFLVAYKSSTNADF
ncbi:MAG: class I SAM-dependent methyltransferase [Patescibacteria group bacterium]